MSPFAELDKVARAMSDLEANRRANRARDQLLRAIARATREAAGRVVPTTPGGSIRHRPPERAAPRPAQQLADVDADLRRLFWAAVRGERRRTINYRRLETQGGVASGPRAEAGYKDDLPDLYGGRTYLGRSGRLGEAAESPDELFAMLAQSLLLGDMWTLDWFRLQPAMVDAFLDAMLRETWASRRHIMLDRWRST